MRLKSHFAVEPDESARPLPMALSDARHIHLLEQIALLGRVNVAECAVRLQVSHETIRRDLRVLERGGHVRCVYGGAVAQVRDAPQDQPLRDRMRLQRLEKARIGRHAAALVPDGCSVFLDTGTTTLALAQHLASRRALRVTTNSLDIARHLGAAGLTQVSVTGGDVRGSDNALVGHATIASIRGQLFDFAFMGIAAIDLAHGCMDYGSEESVLRRALLGQAKRGVLLADRGKFGRTARLCTFGLGEVRSLVTDSPPPPAFAARLHELGVEVLCAD